MQYENKFVDLGLSVYWSTCNLRASAPQEQGMYHALALSTDIEKRGFSVNETSIILGEKEGWRKPSRENFEELFLCCDLFWGEHLGSIGLTVVSRVFPNKYIFFPTTGWRDLDGSIHDEGKCCYWTSDAYQHDHHFAWCFKFDEFDKKCINSYIGYGYCIRPVLPR